MTDQPKKGEKLELRHGMGTVSLSGPISLLFLGVLLGFAAGAVTCYYQDVRRDQQHKDAVADVVVRMDATRDDITKILAIVEGLEK